jgi:hypothetical protein
MALNNDGLGHHVRRTWLLLDLPLNVSVGFRVLRRSLTLSFGEP